MKIHLLAASHGVGPSLWKSQMAALGRSTAEVSLTVRKIARPRSEDRSTLDCQMGGRIVSPNC